MADSLSTSEYRKLAEFRYRIRRFLYFSERAARAAGLEPRQHQLLLAVRAAGGASIRVLSERLQVRHHSAVGLVDRLAGRGLVERRRGYPDRREVHVELTPRGEAELEKLSVSHLEELRQNGPALVQALNAILPASREEKANGR